jgi:hypothetical protein
MRIKKKAAKKKVAKKKAAKKAILAKSEGGEALIISKIFSAFITRKKIGQIKLKTGEKYTDVEIVDHCHGSIFAMTKNAKVRYSFSFSMYSVASLIP